MGRPTKLTDSLGEKIAALYKEGKTDSQVAKLTGVSRVTIWQWRKKYPEFLNTVKEAKDVADDLVESCLFSRATGYNYMKINKGVSFGNEWEVKVPTHIPPDVAACIFWLKNRRPEQWRDTKILELPKAYETKEAKKSFSDFCTTASYPPPFAKQIEMTNFGMCEVDPRLLLGSRGYGKTDYVTILGLAYDIYLNGSTATTLIMTKSKSRNAAILDEIAKALIANGVTLEKQNSICIRLPGQVGKDHAIEALSLKASMRGRHPKRIVFDDIVTDEDTSEAMRVLVKKKYDEAYKLCKNILVIGQPAHKFDLYADLRPILKKMELPHGTIKELDADLQAMKLAGVDEASIQMSYHLKVPADGTIPFNNVKYMDSFPTGDSAVAFIDPSFEGGDYTALSIVKGHMQGVAVVGFVWKRAWNHVLEEMVPHLKKYNVMKLCFETNNLGTMPLDMLRSVFGDAIGVMGRKSNTNKHARIMAAGTYAHLIHLSNQSDKTYLDQVAKYEFKAKNDDAPDSLASCLEWLGLIRGKE